MLLSKRAIYLMQILTLNLKPLNPQIFPKKTVAEINIGPLGLEVLRNKHSRKLELLTQALLTQRSTQ